jgi:hypothetical protein
MLVELAEFTRDEGTILVFAGNTEDGERVTFGVDHRPGGHLLDAMFDPETGQETEAYNEGIYVEVEPWQVLSRED